MVEEKVLNPVRVDWIAGKSSEHVKALGKFPETASFKSLPRVHIAETKVLVGGIDPTGLLPPGSNVKRIPVLALGVLPGLPRDRGIDAWIGKPLREVNHVVIEKGPLRNFNLMIETCS